MSKYICKSEGGVKMDTIEKRIRRWTSKHGYGLTRRQFGYLLRLHKCGNTDDRRFVSELLTDLNFHSTNAYLSAGDYESARADW